MVTGNRRGGLPITYHWGGTDAVKVHLAVKSDWSLKPVYDVIAMLKGTAYPDQWIVRGNHHDGWVFGASDPLTGQVALMSEAKALGALYSRAGGPTRTIVYASWDGEEPGLLGSTEWAETHADELKRKARPLHQHRQQRPRLPARGGQPRAAASGQPGRRRRRRPADRRSGGAARPRRDARRPLSRRRTTSRPRLVDAAKAAATCRSAPLGSGSDYSAFLQHLGIAVAQHRLRRRG